MEHRILLEFRRTNPANALRSRKASIERRHHDRRQRPHLPHLTLYLHHLHLGDQWIADGKFLHLRLHLHQRPPPRHLHLLAIRAMMKMMLRPLIRQEAKRSGLATTQMLLKQAADRLNFDIVLGT